jgi:hypothetical protein
VENEILAAESTSSRIVVTAGGQHVALAQDSSHTGGHGLANHDQSAVASSLMAAGERPGVWWSVVGGARAMS